VNIISMYY